MGNCCGLCGDSSEESAALNVTPEERRQRAAAAAQRRMEESDSRGVKDPHAVQAKLAKREELERREREADQSGGGAALRWQTE